MEVLLHTDDCCNSHDTRQGTLHSGACSGEQDLQQITPSRVEKKGSLLLLWARQGGFVTPAKQLVLYCATKCAVVVLCHG